MPDPIRLGDPKPVSLCHWYAGLIRSGRLGPGETLTVRRVVAEHGVTRRTAHQALRLLAGRGLVEIRQGRGGTVVRGPGGAGVSRG